MIGTPLLFAVLLLATGSGCVGCVIYAGKGTYKSALHKLLLANGISVAFWSAGLALLVSTADVTVAVIGSFLSSIGYSLLLGFFLHYVVILTGHRIRRGGRWLYALVYLPGMVAVTGLSVLPVFGQCPYALERTPLGWVNETWNPWVWFCYVYYAAFLGIVIRLLYKWGKEAGSDTIRKQAKDLLHAILATAVCGTLTDVMPGFLHHRTPDIAAAFAIFPILSICYGVHRLHFMLPERPNPDEMILNKASRAKGLYILFGSCFTAGSVLNLLGQTVFSGGRDSLSAVPFSVVLLAGGIAVFILCRFLRDDGLRELALSFIFSLFIPLITFRFAEYGGITIWIFVMLLMAPSMLFNRRILLVTVLYSELTTQMVLMGTTPGASVRIGASDYIIRLGLILLMALLCSFVTLAYRQRLHENTVHSMLQRAVAAVSQSLLTVNPSNWEDGVPEALGRCGAFFRFDRAYLALLGDGEREIRATCEWAADEHPGSGTFSEEAKRRLLAAVERCFAGGDVIALSEKNGDFPGSEELRTALSDLHLKSAVAAMVRIEGKAAGFLCFGTVRPIQKWEDDQVSFLQIISDIFADTLIKLEAVRKVQFLAYHDQLTGLPNRLLLADRLKKSMPLADRRSKIIGVVFLDFDSFKSVNDTMGHELGDQLLIRLSESISNCVRKYDTVARFGGDEFVLILDQLSSTEDLLHIIDKIMDVIRKPVVMQGQEFYMTGSAGIALYPQDGRDVETLISNADIAMYHAKSTGKNRYALCSQDMKDEIIQQMRMTNLLYRALELRQLVVYYQPQVDLETNEIRGLEALLRWNLPDQGMIGPGVFIPLAEKTGLIQPIGQWVLETACRQSRKWQEQGYAPVRMAVNVSVQQLYAGNFADQVDRVLESTGLPPELLELEVTESIANSGAPNIARVFAALKSMGISLSIDDFGTEYSSLNRLKLLPVDRLKLDIQFISGIENSEKDRAITKTIIVLAKSLKMKVIAEGVETRGQMEFLSKERCDEAQGFYCYRPMPAEEVERYLRRIPSR